MYKYFTELAEWYNANAVAMHRSIFVVIAGGALILLVPLAARKFLKKRISEQGIMLLNKFLTYGGSFIIIIIVLRELNFKLSAILGAAGIAGISLGFGGSSMPFQCHQRLFYSLGKAIQAGRPNKSGQQYGICLFHRLAVCAIENF